MLNFIDISSYQGWLDLVAASSDIQAVVIKATEGESYVNPCCDAQYQQAKSIGLLRGFYHYARNGNPESEAQYFYDNTSNYFHDGIPVLDWEENQSVDWVNRFVRKIHELSDVWCWIYANPWRFNQGGVEPNCARWLASYPEVVSPTFAQAANWDCPSADGNVVAWQFCSDGHVNGWNAGLDCDLYYGDSDSWCRYAGSQAQVDNGTAGDSANSKVTLSGGGYRVTVERE